MAVEPGRGLVREPRDQTLIHSPGTPQSDDSAKVVDLRAFGR